MRYRGPKRMHKLMARPAKFPLPALLKHVLRTDRMHTATRTYRTYGRRPFFLSPVPQQHEQSSGSCQQS